MIITVTEVDRDNSNNIRTYDINTERSDKEFVKLLEDAHENDVPLWLSKKQLRHYLDRSKALGHGWYDSVYAVMVVKFRIEKECRFCGRSDSLVQDYYNLPSSGETSYICKYCEKDREAGLAAVHS